MSNFISRLLKGTAGISLNNSFKCQSFVEVNPTVNRRSTDSQIQRQYSVSTRLFRLAALVALLFIANIGDVWGGNKVLTIGAGETLYFDFTAMGTPDKTSVCWRDATNTADDKLPADGNGAGTVIAVYYATAQDMYDDQAIAKTEKANWATITVKARSAGQNMLKFNSDGTSFEWTTARTFTTGEKIYFKDASGNMSNLSNSLWKVNTLDTYPAHIYAYFMGRTDGGANAWSEAMTCVTGTWDVANAVYEFVVPDDGSGNNKTWTKVLITRGVAASFDNSQTKNQTRDLVLEQGYNLFYIWNSKCSDNKFRCGVGRYGYPAALVGEFNGWNAYANTFNNGSTNISLSVGDNQQFKILVGESFLGNTGTFTSSDKEWVFDNENNCKISVSTAGTYYFNYYYDGNASKYKVTVIYPNLAAKKILTKNKYIYFNASSASTDADGWRKEDFNTRFWFKYYDSGIDQSSADCSKSSALENWVYYTQVPDNDYIGRIQLNRIDPGNSSTVWCTAERAYAYERTNGDENCLTTESDHEGWCNSWRPQWTYYCPPMSSATITHNSTNTVTYGGDGGENTPYLVAAGSNIYVSAGSTSALADNNMTPYYQFKKEGANDGGESDSNTHTYTASNTNNTKEAMTVVARNKYSSTYGTASDASSAIYYEARTPYTISYNKGTNGTGTRGSEIKVDGVSFTLPSTAIFTRTGYTQTGWTKTDGGTQTHALGAGYTDNVAQEFFPVWTANNYTVTLDNKEADAGHEGTESVNVTFDATTGLTSAITKPSKEHYDFGGYYVSNDAGVTLTETQLIDANGNWNKNVSGYTGSSGDNATWVYANDITLYAKWTEHEYTVTIAVTGSGSTSPANSTTAKYVTESGNITATPSAGWHFRDWAFTKTDDKDDIWCASGYGSTNATIHIKAQHDGTLTAHFDPTNYVVRLEDKGADAGHKGTPNVSVTYSTTTNLTSAIDCPQKRYYDFGGYWISTDGGTTLTTQLINTDGTWKHNVSGYTGESGDYATWACAGDTTLYAKWTEHAYTVTASVSPAGAGSVNTVTDAHLTIPSSTITATPINAAWVFDHWVCGDSVGISTGDGTNVVTVTAAKNSTITAHFKPRYALVGTLTSGNDEVSGGNMPGWEFATAIPFTYNGFTALGTGDGSGVDLSCTRSLNSNATYKFMILDRSTGGGSYGVAPDGGQTFKAITEENQPLYFANQDNKVYLYTFATESAMDYTFRITNITESAGKYYPTVTVERPHQMHMGHKRVDIDGGDHSDDTGGTLTATIGGNSASNGDWFDYKANISFTASAETGYTLTWYTNSTYTSKFSPQPAAAWPDNNVTHDENVYAQFTEQAKTVTINKTGSGTIQVAGDDFTWGETKTCGVTTTRRLVATPASGYTFTGWTLSDDPYFELTAKASETDNDVTLHGLTTGSSGTLTANFTETLHSVTVDSTSNYVASGKYGGHVEQGGVQVSSAITGVGITTTATITAVPANAAWRFKNWTIPDGVTIATGDANTATIAINVTADGKTVTANFEPRFGLIGSTNANTSEAGGMPSPTWTDNSAADFTVEGFTALGTGDGTGVNLQCTRTLEPNKNYVFQIYDREKGVRRGHTSSDPNTSLLDANASTTLSSTNNVHINTVGYGTYTFKITNLSNDDNNYPTVTVTRQNSYQFNFGCTSGGTASAYTRNGALAIYPLTNGQFVAAGDSIVFSAVPADGYSFDGWYNSDAYSDRFAIDPNMHIRNINATVNAYAKFVPVTLTFTNNSGSGDGNWNTASNWSPACVPTIDHDVVITKPVTVDITNARANSVVIYNDGSTHTGQLEIAAGKELVVAGTVRKTTNGSTYVATDEEDIVFDSSSSLGLGALVMGSHDGTNKATVNFATLSHGATDDNTSVNQYVGTPFSDATVISDWYNSWVYGIKYTNGNIGWERVQGDMDPFKGYTVISADGAGHSYWMQGTLVSSANHTCSGLNWKSGSGAKNENNENLLANSWMAPIKIGAMQTTDFTNTDATVYIFNSTSESAYASGGFAGNYTTHTVGTSEGVIPAMQSFSVFTTGSSASVVLDYNKIVYAPALAGTATPVANYAPQRRAIGEETNKMHLYVHTEGGYGDMVYLLSREDFENGFENGFDGRKVFGESAAPQMYAITPDGNMAVNCVPTMEGTVLGFRKGSGDSQYIFSFDYEGLETLYLNDLKAQTSTLIDASNSYTFTAAAEDDEARFIISATPIGQMPTEVETPSGSPSRGEKILINGQLYIIRHGQMYSAEGCLVK